VPAYPEILAKTLGGPTSYQVVTTGGMDKNGDDATNELSYILLELMDGLHMRQPDSHVRIHKKRTGWVPHGGAALPGWRFTLWLCVQDCFVARRNDENGCGRTGKMSCGQNPRL